MLEELALAHDLPRLILEWRALMKLKGTYIDALPQLVNPETGRVHTCFNQAVAATGRLSSSDPNLQNIPIRTELGREIRRAFIADPGHVLISADYSQIEFRVLAHLSEDPVLVDAFREGADFHERTALKIFGADSGRDPHELRSIAKMVNYALLYGKTRVHARQGHRRHAAGGAGVHRRLLRRLPARPRLHRPHARGGARDRRRQDDVRPAAAGAGADTAATARSASAAEREAVNMPIQGIGRRHHEARDDRRPRRARAAPGRADDPHGPRRAAVRSAEGARGGDRRARPRADAGGRGANVPLTVDVGIGENWKDAKS